MPKESFRIYYQIIVEYISGRSAYSYYFTSHKEARKKYREAKSCIGKSWSDVHSVKLCCFVHYFDNCGRLVCAFGDSKKDAYKKLSEIIDK